MSTNSNDHNAPLVEIAKAVGAILGVPLALFALTNSVTAQPTIALIVAVITAVLVSVWVTYYSWTGITEVIVAWLALALVVLAGLVLWPKTMTVEGTILDTAGTPVSYERVVLIDVEGVSRETRTDEEGYYQFNGVPHGKYRVRVGEHEAGGEPSGFFPVSLMKMNLIVLQPTSTPTPTVTSANTPTPTTTPTAAPTDTTTATPTPITTPMNTLTPTVMDTPTATPTNTPTLMPTPTSSPAFIGKVCQIKSGWDPNTIFLREAEFDTLGLPIGTRVTVTVLDTGESVENVTLSLDSRLEICSVRLAKPLRDLLGVDDDTDIQPETRRPDRQFDITPTSPPTNEEAINTQGKICMIKANQDTTTIFLRQAEFDAFGVPAGTTVSVSVFDTGKSVEKITLDLDSDLAICTVRLPKSYREALGVAEDINIEPVENRPNRQFSIRLPQP